MEIESQGSWAFSRSLSLWAIGWLELLVHYETLRVKNQEGTISGKLLKAPVRCIGLRAELQFRHEGYWSMDMDTRTLEVRKMS